MEKNLILKRGDFVKALCDVDTVDGTLTRGQVYLVEALLDGGLGVAVLSGLVELVRPNGTLTDACLDVALYRGTVATLPRGNGNG